MLILAHLIYNYSGTENIFCRLGFSQILSIHIQTVGLLYQQCWWGLVKAWVNTVLNRGSSIAKEYRFFENHQKIWVDFSFSLPWNSNNWALEQFLIAAKTIHWLKTEGGSVTSGNFLYFFIFNFLNFIRHLFAVDWLVGEKSTNLT